MSQLRENSVTKINWELAMHREDLIVISSVFPLALMIVMLVWWRVARADRKAAGSMMTIQGRWRNTPTRHRSSALSSGAHWQPLYDLPHLSSARTRPWVERSSPYGSPVSDDNAMSYGTEGGRDDSLFLDESISLMGFEPLHDDGLQLIDYTSPDVSSDNLATD